MFYKYLFITASSCDLTCKLWHHVLSHISCPKATSYKQLINNFLFTRYFSFKINATFVRSFTNTES